MPIPTPHEMLDVIRSTDWNTKVGRSGFYRWCSPFTPARQSWMMTTKETYRLAGFTVGDSWKMAALDMLAIVPGSSAVASEIVALRPPPPFDSGSLPKIDPPPVITPEEINIKAQNAKVLARKRRQASNDRISYGKRAAKLAEKEGLVKEGEDGETVIVKKALGHKRTSQYQKLYDEVFYRKSNRVSMADETRWVAAHLGADWGQIGPDDVPSLDALTMLNWAKGNEGAFRATYHAKLIPVKSFGTEDDGFVDDGGPISDVLEALKGFEKERTKDVSNDSVRRLSAKTKGGNVHRVSGDEGLPSPPVSPLSRDDDERREVTGEGRERGLGDDHREEEVPEAVFSGSSQEAAGEGDGRG